MWPGLWIACEAQPADLDHLGVVEEHVVADVFQLRRVERGDGDLVAGLAHRRHRLDVVPVAVGLEHAAHAERLAQLEQLLVLVGGVDAARRRRCAGSARRTRCCRTGPTTTLCTSTSAFDQWSVVGGKPGSRRVIINRRGEVVEDVESIRAPQAGRDLALAIDTRLQYLA